MAQYAFYVRGTNKRESLHKVDNFVCELMGDPIHETRYHPLYDAFLTCAFAYLMKNGGSTLPESINVVPEHLREQEQFKRDAELLGKVSIALTEKYEVTAWR